LFGGRDFNFFVDMQNNKFTIVFGRTLPFPSISLASEITEQLIHCFYFLKWEFIVLCIVKLWGNPNDIYLSQELVGWILHIDNRRTASFNSKSSRPHRENGHKRFNSSSIMEE